MWDTARVPSGYFLPTPSNVTLATQSPSVAEKGDYKAFGWIEEGFSPPLPRLAGGTPEE
jgi:hypothetical protein